MSSDILGQNVMRLYGLTKQLENIKPQMAFTNPDILYTFISSYRSTTNVLSSLISEDHIKVYHLFHTYTVQRYAQINPDATIVPNSYWYSVKLEDFS